MLEYLKKQTRENIIMAMIMAIVFILIGSQENIVYNGLMGLGLSLVISYAVDIFWYSMGWVNNDESGE